MSRADEIQVLQTYLKNPLEFSTESHTQRKFLLMTEIRRQHLLPAGLRMTNLGPSEELKFQNLDFTYAYRRQSVDFQIPRDDFQFLGCPPLTDQKVLPIMTNSGQAATAATLLALQFYYKKLMLVVPDGLYWETAEICRRLDIEYVAPKRASTLASRPKIGFLDSSTLSNLSDSLKQMKDTELLVIDTTCWDVSAPEFQILEEEAAQKTVICVRSHLKLDSLGAEYGSLGSILVLHSNHEELIREIQTQVRLIGGLSELDGIYPFLFDSRFHAVNSKRNSRLREFGQKLVQDLRGLRLPEGVTLQTFAHDLFFYLQFSKAFFKSPETLKLPLLRSLLMAAQIPFKEAASFGFDFFVFKQFQQLTENDEPWILRMTSADLPTEQRVILSQALANWLDKLA